MFRIASSVLIARNLLYRRVQISDVQVAAISRTPPNFKYKNPKERDPCPVPPPPPPPPPKDDSLFWGVMTLIMLTGGFAVYAKTNPELRDWISIYAPWFDEVVAIIYQENLTFGQFSKQCIENTKEAFNRYFIQEEKPKCTPDGTPIKEVEAPPEPMAECKEVVAKKDDDDAEPCVSLPPPIVTKDICEIERCLRDLGETALINYMTAHDACVYYNKLVEDTMVKFTIPGMREAHAAMDERIELVNESLANAQCAIAKLDELTKYFECGIRVSKDELKNTKDLLLDYRTKMSTVKMQWQWQNDKALALDVQLLKVEELIDKFTEENEAMFKNLKYAEKKPHIYGDADLLLHHAKRYVDQLRGELADLLAGMTERVNRGLETLPRCEKDKKAQNADIAYLFKQKRAALDAEYKQRLYDLKASLEKTRRNEIQKQYEKSLKTLEIRLQETTVKANKKLDEVVATQVEVEKKRMSLELHHMAASLALVEDKLNARLKAERETRRSQELWSAGASLLAATKKGDPYVRVDKELKAIEKASGDGDKLVLSVLKAIPKSVREKGVVPESVLREKYHVMESTALKVALVEQEGAPLFVYFISYLQSIFLFMKISGIPQPEYDKPPKEPEKGLDTFDLLQRARFWLEHGNVALALKYVTALQGASRAAAESWYDAARSYLETRQAAEAVIAHATALGLQYI